MISLNLPGCDKCSVCAIIVNVKIFWANSWSNVVEATGVRGAAAEAYDLYVGLFLTASRSLIIAFLLGN